MEKNKEVVNVAFAPDDNYVMPTSVAVKSLLENNKVDISIHIFCIEGHLSVQSMNVFKEIIKGYKASINFYQVPIEMLKPFPQLRQGLSTYLRLCAPSLCKDIDKLLYLDGDIVVNGSIEELYNTDIINDQIAGCIDTLTLHPEYLTQTGHRNNRPYINAGVLLMNLKLLRDIDIITLANQYVNKYGNIIRFSDQDMINNIFPNIHILAPKYNALPVIWQLNRNLRKQLWSKKEILEARHSPVIIHFITALKPWHYNNMHFHKNLWYNYLSKTCYKDYLPKVQYDKIPTMIASVIKKQMQKIIVKVECVIYNHML